MGSGLSFGYGGMALQRAADAMLRALGGSSVVLVFPLAVLPDDPSAQLGLVDPGVQQVPFAPVVVRDVATTVARTLTTASKGPCRRLEFLISSSCVAAQLPLMNMASADALFEYALGILFDNQMFHIESVVPEYFGGTAYLYRVTAVE
jgi:hypothetical protein